MIKNADLVNKKEKIFLAKKRKIIEDSPKKILLNIEQIDKKSPINKENDKKKSIKYEKYAQLIEDFYTNKYVISTIQDDCLICHMNGFSNKLLYFKNPKHLFYYLKYIFCLNKNKLYEDNKTFLDNQKQIIDLNKYDFFSNFKFYSSKTICKNCFLNLINKKNIIQNLKIIFLDKDNNIISLHNTLNKYNIEIKKDELFNIKNKKENINNIKEEKINKKRIFKNIEINHNLNEKQINNLNNNNNDNTNKNIFNIRNNVFFNNNFNSKLKFSYLFNFF